MNIIFLNKNISFHDSLYNKKIFYEFYSNKESGFFLKKYKIIINYQIEINVLIIRLFDTLSQ